MGRRWLKLLPKHEYFSESPNRTSKSTIACKLNAQFELNYPFLRISRIIGATCYSSPAKARKKSFWKKFMPLILMIFITNNDKRKKVK